MRPDWEKAVRADDVVTLERLADDGVDIDALDRYGQTGLMIAAVEGKERTVRFLVEHGAALDHTAKYRLSALMLAVINGHVEIVRTLVQAGADTELRGSGAPGFHGKTAEQLAAARGDDEVVEILRAAGPDVESPVDGA